MEPYVRVELHRSSDSTPHHLAAERINSRRRQETGDEKWLKPSDNNVLVEFSKLGIRPPYT